MDFYLDDLTIKLTGINIADILSSLTWLIKDWDEVLLISKLGDLFFKAKDGGVYWLATDSCELTKIADSKQEFYSFLNDDEKTGNWFLPQLLKQLEQAGIQLNYNQIYSYKKRPVLGGEYTIDNLEAVDINIHFNLTGIIGEQIKDLPNGTKIKIKIAD